MVVTPAYLSMAIKRGSEMAQAEMVENKLIDLKRFFTPEGKNMTTAEFKAEWDKLSDEEKAWFKSQHLK